MKYGISCRIVALAIGLSLLMTTAIPSTPALAQSITLSHTSGFRGTKVTVTGTAFYGNENSDVYLYFSNNRIRTIKVSDNATFTTDFSIPDYATSGTAYDVTIQDEDGIELTRERFVVEAKIDLDRSDGKTGTWIQIRGFYFEGYERRL